MRSSPSRCTTSSCPAPSLATTSASTSAASPRTTSSAAMLPARSTTRRPWQRPSWPRSWSLTTPRPSRSDTPRCSTATPLRSHAPSSSSRRPWTPRPVRPRRTNPTFLKTGDVAIVKVEPTKPMVVEKAKDFPQLGRFAIRDMGATVAAGMCIDVEKKEM